MRTLEGLRVIDLSHAAAMPSAALILADMGADVIKVEPPTGDHFRYAMGGAIMASTNRNKRGIVIDLKRSEGKEILRKLCKDADVFLESFVPGAVKNLGFGYEDVAKLNPRIIYASVSGFGQTGPYREKRGYDIVAQAMSGIMMITGEPDRPPVRVGISAIDLGTGMYAVIGILLALIDRGKTGQGQYIEVSLLETALSWMKRFIAAYSNSGEIPERMGSALPFLVPYQVFETIDGPVFIGISTDRFWQEFCKLFNLDDMAMDPRFKTNQERVIHRQDLLSKLIPFLKKKHINEVLEKLNGSEIPYAPILRVDQIIEDQHVIYRKIIEETNHPEYGKIKLVKTPIFRDGIVPDIGLPSPKLGQHTREILQELGYGEEEIRKLALNKTILMANSGYGCE